MASSCISTLCAVSFLLVLSICASATSPKVKLYIYYGSMESNSAAFLANHLPSLFSTGLIDIVELNLIPSQGSFIRNNSIVTCQNGEEECFLSMQELCAMQKLVDPRKYGMLVSCLESLVQNGTYRRINSCIQGEMINPIASCVKSGLGKYLLLNMKRDKNIYAPPPNFKPWVLVNGRALRESAPAFLHYICDAFAGARPKACSN
ncbi:hypothetical protein ACHQM5_025279 [Ranunculus cassubicifolius]